MKFITLDTCIWLGLLKTDLNSNIGLFDEVCFWIENKYIIHIVPENIIREWERSKTSKITEIVKDAKNLSKNAVLPFKGNPDLMSAYQPEAVEEIIVARVERVDAILKACSEIILDTYEIYVEAAKRNLNCLAPNHSEDSYRDTINILSLIQYLKIKGYSDCCFSTIDCDAFSENKNHKHTLHPQLVNDFASVNLHYIYCDEQPFGNKLIHTLRSVLPSFQDFLNEQRRIEEEKILIDKKAADISEIQNLDKDFLENIRHIDIILKKDNPTAFELGMIKQLISLDDSYKLYFLRNVGSNGMV